MENPMNIEVTLSNINGKLNCNFTSKAYAWKLVSAPGYSGQFYDSQRNPIDQITLEDLVSGRKVFFKATGAATVLLQEKMDGEWFDMEDTAVQGIIVRRCDAEGNFYEGSLVMQKNGEVYKALPYSFIPEEEIANGPMVYLALDPATIPAGYKLASNAPVGLQLIDASAEMNQFIFQLIRNEYAETETEGV